MPYDVRKSDCDSPESQQTKRPTAPTLTDRDFVRLEAFCYIDLPNDSSLRNLIENLLRTASVVSTEEAPPNLVTIGSQIRYRLGTSEVASGRITLPGVGLYSSVFIPVNAPLGLAVIGRQVPDEIRFIGDCRPAIKLLQLEFQPERELRKPSAQAWVNYKGILV